MSHTQKNVNRKFPLHLKHWSIQVMVRLCQTSDALAGSPILHTLQI